MRKIWNIEIEGRRHEIDVSWNVSMTGSGRIAVDGAVVESWGAGPKWPGLTHAVNVEGRAGQVTQGWLGFDLDLEGVALPPPRVEGGQTSWKAIAVVVALVTLVLVLGGVFLLTLVLLSS